MNVVPWTGSEAILEKALTILMLLMSPLYL